MSLDVTRHLADQLEWHWDNQLRPRLDGLDDAEYLWDPEPNCWSVRRRGESTAPIQGGTGDHVIEFAIPEPHPAPLTTIAWRLGHIVVGVFGARNAAHFGGPATDYFTHDYPGDARTAVRQLDDAYTCWRDGVRGLDDDALARPVGDAEGPWAHHPMIDLVLHIHREVIHHGAEIALLRDLYAHRPR